MGSAKRAVKVLDFDLHGSPYTHTKANVALNTIFLVLSIEQNGPPKVTFPHHSIEAFFELAVSSYTNT
jgi:hypothetical protein